MNEVITIKAHTPQLSMPPRPRQRRGVARANPIRRPRRHRPVPNQHVAEDPDLAHDPIDQPPEDQPIPNFNIDAIADQVTRAVLDKIQNQPIQPIISTENRTLTQGNDVERYSNNDCQVTSINSELGYNIANNVKIKIINNEYIDLGILVSKPRDPDDQSNNISVKNGSLVISPKSRTSVIVDIQQWTDAFLELVEPLVKAGRVMTFNLDLRRKKTQNYRGLLWTRNCGFCTCIIILSITNLLLPYKITSLVALNHSDKSYQRQTQQVEPIMIPGQLKDLYKRANTPVNCHVLQTLLSLYPKKLDADLLYYGFLNGFKLNYDGPRVSTDCQNLKSVRCLENEALQIIMKEVELKRIAGPFFWRPLEKLRISPIVNYTPFDSALEMLATMGKGALAARLDIKSAFRLLPIHPSDFDLLGYKICGLYFVDKCLPFGCSISCSLFEKFSTFLEWEYKKRSNCDNLKHYLDDFFLAGKPNTNQCQQSMQLFSSMCDEIGVPLAHDKTIPPSTVLTYLGLEINTIKMTVKIPFEKLTKLKNNLCLLLNRKKCTLKELQSLVGLLNFCTRAIPPARAFNRRLYDAMCGLTKHFHKVRINNDMKEDIRMWLLFLDIFNGVLSYDIYRWINAHDIQLFTDSAGGARYGCSAILGSHWSYILWPACWHNAPILQDITFLELVPITMTDNLALVSILNKKSSKSKRVMQLLRPLVLQSMLYNVQFRSVHVSDCPRVVWIVGSSIISHAMTRAIKSTFKKNLQLETNNLSVLWQGKPGMRWEQVFNKIKYLITFIDPPEFLLLHCGGNDIGSSLKSVELIHLILNTIVKIFKLLPKTRLIWSQILPRLEWRNEVNHRALNKVRVRVNRKIANFVLKNNGFYIKYPELIESNTGCFSKDNVHLSDLGNDLFLFRIQQALQTFLTTNHIVSPPYGESGPWLNMF
ncbi:hypothetical protein KUTeg_024427 [Tegillarca granosa]|uniref:Reverse transcriptase domain-containing protein n=1 Tax=Tegillarca granosa TaxID=220873 RepID=A0ABQ9E2E9_TEGGR|nr:hypothetical protein KUTeg_024427 [Tegillarca granosa]